MNKDIYIHIGYPKTATTTLQKELFAKHSELYYINDYLVGDFMKEIFWGRVSNIQRNKIFYWNRLNKILLKTNRHRNIVISNEGFTSVEILLGKVRRMNSNNFFIYPDASTIAEKIRIIFLESGLFENVFIICTIRRQKDFLKSYYAQEFNRFFKVNKELKSFRKFKNFILANKDTFIIDSLDYFYKLIPYENNFGKENLKVFVFEELKNSPQEFYSKISYFLSINNQETQKLTSNKFLNTKKTNKGYKTEKMSVNKYLLTIKRLFGIKQATGFTKSNLYKYFESIKFGGKTIKDLEYDDEEISKLRNIFEESNKKLSEKYNLNLEKYDYF